MRGNLKCSKLSLHIMLAHLHLHVDTSTAGIVYQTMLVVQFDFTDLHI